MLDEPFAGIDPVTVQNIQRIIRGLANDGIAILITDHAAREILQITDRTYVVSDGRILISGTAEEIIANDVVREKYLGEIRFARDQAMRTAEKEGSEVDDAPADPSEGLQESPRVRFHSTPGKRIVTTIRSNDLE
jgi:lipopolysaccharide export system ATP-binding protein